MRVLAAIASVAMLSGCLGAIAPDSAQLQNVVPELRSPLEVQMLARPVLVSPPGHRIAEFMIDQHPQDPNHLVVAYHDYDSPSGTLNCRFAVSGDGGRSWSPSGPVPGLDRPHLQFDAWLSFDDWGVLHMICLDTAGQQAQTWPYYSQSQDGGHTWSKAVLIPTETEGQSTDKASIFAGSDGTIYAAFSRQVARSLDGGRTWEAGRTIADGGIYLPNGFVEADDGGVHLLGHVGGGMYGVATTRDRGASWRVTPIASAAIAPGYNDQNRWIDQRPWSTNPNLVRSPSSGALLLASQSWDDQADGFRFFLHRSVDAGLTWQSRSVPDFQSSSCGACHITKPALAIDPDGVLLLQAQVTPDGGHLKEVFVAASGDEGDTWSAPVALSRTSAPDGWAHPSNFAPRPYNAVSFGSAVGRDPADAQAAVIGLALTTAVAELQLRWNGEYWAMGWSEIGFVALWIDHSGGGTPQLWSQIVRTTQVTI